MSARLLIPRLIPWSARPRAPMLRRSTALIHTTAARRVTVVPHVDKCPEPVCPCEPAPDLDIDREGRLRGAFAPYTEQVLVCTGRDDWVSKVEDEERFGGDVMRGLKEGFGLGGKFRDPYNNVSVLASSFPSPGPSAAAYLFPSFKYIPSIPASPESLSSFTRAHLLPRTLHRIYDDLPLEDRQRLTRDPTLSAAAEAHAIPVRDVVVLICGHGGRDERCGVMGPLLRSKFRSVLAQDGIAIDDSPPAALPDQGRPKEVSARVGLISHIGAHKFAGNVIVYVPPGMVDATGDRHPLAGCGVWYGRVDARHVEGIVKETIRQGRVIAELFRGGMDSKGGMLDIDAVLETRRRP